MFRLRLKRGVTTAWPHITYGVHSYGGKVVWHEGDPPQRVTIGSYTSIANGAKFMIGGNHRLDWGAMFPFRSVFGLAGAWQDGHPASNGDIEVGSDVWIGHEALIMSGIRIGHGSVVAARAVVTTDVGPYEIVGGVPARLIRKRFTDDQIADLLAIAWWDWPEEELLSVVNLMNGAPVDELIAYGKRRPKLRTPGGRT